MFLDNLKSACQKIVRHNHEDVPYHSDLIPTETGAKRIQIGTAQANTLTFFADTKAEFTSPALYTNFRSLKNETPNIL